MMHEYIGSNVRTMTEPDCDQCKYCQKMFGLMILYFVFQMLGLIATMCTPKIANRRAEGERAQANGEAANAGAV